MESGIYLIEYILPIQSLPSYMVFYPAEKAGETMTVFLIEKAGRYVPLKQTARISPISIDAMNKEELLARVRGFVKDIKKVASLEELGTSLAEFPATDKPAL